MDMSGELKPPGRFTLGEEPPVPTAKEPVTHNIRRACVQEPYQRVLEQYPVQLY